MIGQPYIKWQRSRKMYEGRRIQRVRIVFTYISQKPLFSIIYFYVVRLVYNGTIYCIFYTYIYKFYHQDLFLGLPPSITYTQHKQFVKCPFLHMFLGIIILSFLYYNMWIVRVVLLKHIWFLSFGLFCGDLWSFSLEYWTNS